jgi:hypothetical protein
MVNFEKLQKNADAYRLEYLSAKPFPHLVLDNFCDSDKLVNLFSEIPDLENRSRDYMFAHNKFEKSNYSSLGQLFKELQDDLCSAKMNDFLSFISSKNVFVDPKNFGGGLHQGRTKSSLDMHLDFNYHPLEKSWFREMNLLLYLNRDWQPEHRGELKLEDLRTGEKREIGIPFNRMIIQQCSSFSLHGYDAHNFPTGKYRTSIATYAYVKHIRAIEKPRTTDWFPGDDASAIKKSLGRKMKYFVRFKSFFLGSGTAKNQ